MATKATIAHNDETREDRVNLELREEDGKFVWYAAAEGEEWSSSDVWGDTKEDAIEAAEAAWGAAVWELEFVDEEGGSGATVTIAADEENNSDTFWAAIDEAYPAIADQLRDGDATVDAETWAAIQGLEGFSDGPGHARNALVEVQG